MTLTATRRTCSACQGRANLQQVADRIGFRIHRVRKVGDAGSSPDSRTYWDGARLLSRCAVAEEDLAHEIGHWLAARPERRGRKNYGLVNHLGNDSPTKRRSQDSSQREEERASRIGFALLLLHGWPKRRVLSLCRDDYGWNDLRKSESGSAAIRRGLRHLRRLDRTSHLFSPENTIRCCDCGHAESLGETTKEKAK